MREIKFRVLSLKGNTIWYINKQMKLSIEGDSWQVRDDVIGNRFLCSWHENEKGILMQYTGLKDKNTKDIYEGDIISVKGHTYEDTFTSTVAYRRGGFVFDDKGYYIGDYKEYMLEVIGNIYENKEKS